jgi:dihydropteroate synthase
MKFYLKKEFLELEEPVIMGILNITPDSFSDGGTFFRKNDAALKHAEKMVKDGAQIIDVGGESTRPGAEVVGADEEIDRVLPVVEKLKNELEVMVSIDTYKARVAKAAVLEAGADIVNDISALSFSKNMAEVVSRLDVPVILMHIKGTPAKMQKNPYYSDVVSELKQYFYDRIEYAISKGIKREKIIIDPGIGFGKRLEDNIEIIKNLGDFQEFELPVLLGVSRKSFLGKITGEEDPGSREIESVIANLTAHMNGASILRVHHVRNTFKAIQVFKELTDFS